MARLAIAAVQTLKSKGKVVVVGQPGIGKTRGGLPYILQELLSQGKAVIVVAFQTDALYLFLPQKEGRLRGEALHKTGRNRILRASATCLQ